MEKLKSASRWKYFNIDRIEEILETHPKAIGGGARHQRPVRFEMGEPGRRAGHRLASADRGGFRRQHRRSFRPHDRPAAEPHREPFGYRQGLFARNVQRIRRISFFAPSGQRTP